MSDSDSPDRPPDVEPSPSRPPGRWSAALSVLRGQNLVPDQIRWEWAEYQHQFNDLLQRYSATLARAAKAEKKRLAALHESLDQARLEEPHNLDHRQLSPSDRKSELRHRAAQLRGLHLSPSSSPQPAPLPREEDP